MKKALTSRWIFFLSAGLILTIALSFLAGFFVKSSNEEAIQNSHSSPTVWAHVEERVFTPPKASIEGVVSTGSSISVTIPASEEPAVVTSLSVKAGDVVRTGTVLGRVSGRPVIVLNLPFALYRDIYTGDSGDDVRELQNSLKNLGLYSGAVDGVYGSQTETAIKKLYTDRGLQPPTADSIKLADNTMTLSESKENSTTDSTTISTPEPSTTRELTPRQNVFLRYHDIFSMATDQATIESVLPVGSALDSETPFATLRSGEYKITARSPASLKDAFIVGTHTSVSVNGSDVEGVVSYVSEFRQAGTDRYDSVPGYDVDISIPDGPQITEGATAIVSVASSVAERTGLAVPVTALREENGASYLVRGEKLERVSVDVSAVEDGWALITSDTIKEGDAVVVSVKP